MEFNVLLLERRLRFSKKDVSTILLLQNDDWKDYIKLKILAEKSDHTIEQKTSVIKNFSLIVEIFLYTQFCLIPTCSKYSMYKKFQNWDIFIVKLTQRKTDHSSFGNSSVAKFGSKDWTGDFILFEGRIMKILMFACKNMYSRVGI